MQSLFVLGVIGVAVACIPGIVCEWKCPYGDERKKNGEIWDILKGRGVYEQCVCRVPNIIKPSSTGIHCRLYGCRTTLGIYVKEGETKGDCECVNVVKEGIKAPADKIFICRKPKGVTDKGQAVPAKCIINKGKYVEFGKKKHGCQCVKGVDKDDKDKGVFYYCKDSPLCPTGMYVGKTWEVFYKHDYLGDCVCRRNDLFQQANDCVYGNDVQG